MASTSPHNLSDGTTFVLGGARSGKSVFAENLLINSALKPIYLATARAGDDEMAARIEKHQERREELGGSEWQTIEEPLALADALRNCAYEGRAVLVDCLTLWVTNLMAVEANVEREIVNLIRCLDELDAPVVFVSNEVGLGIVPDNAMAREFCDLAGMVNRKIAANADRVFFIAAGLPLVLKGEG